ncbi:MULTISPECIES: hypothetical protein [unclassified Pseudomonas]|uniref:hypothetical protein n=1 Tax=unclassified Pseudomonas TaxID=196821 RepID=UPI000D37B2D0|nr:MULTISPECIES: hypothetical protein [unclassified Pseudomonas]RAU43468.1 hypothetical protein DBP26_019920 [Pseudomonas sp. RIT 409]RAU49995.1 hypothetical protein DBY65_022865 [Pseudomonas sp. RIT 412]
MEKKGAAKHSADYRERQNAEKARLGIETVKVDMPIGVKSGITRAMKDHGYSQMQELWQDLVLSFLSMPHEEQTRRLRKPDASAFVITPKLARQFDRGSRRELARDSGDAT